MTIVKQPLAAPKHERCPTIMGYSLHLNDGSSWWMSGDDVEPWLDKLSVIMSLENTLWDGSSKLIFSKMRNVEPSESSPQTGWTYHDYSLIRVWRHSRIDQVICEIQNSEVDQMGYVNMRHSLQPVYQESIYRGGLPIHAGLAVLDGRGVLLAGHGNSGKSTCCARLPDCWDPLCDDEVLVVLDKQREYQAHPFPTWSDYILRHAEKTWDTQNSMPLSGIFFLEQSETDVFTPLGTGESAVLIGESADQVCKRFWREASTEYQRVARKELFNNACEMAKAIPTFRLSVSLHGRFWEQMENALGWRTL